jgi:hypothetical protein
MCDLPTYAVRRLSDGRWELIGPDPDPRRPPWHRWAIFHPLTASARSVRRPQRDSRRPISRHVHSIRSIGFRRRLAARWGPGAIGCANLHSRGRGECQKINWGSSTDCSASPTRLSGFIRSTHLTYYFVQNATTQARMINIMIADPWVTAACSAMLTKRPSPDSATSVVPRSSALQ